MLAIGSTSVGSFGIGENNELYYMVFDFFLLKEIGIFHPPMLQTWIPEFQLPVNQVSDRLQNSMEN